MRVALVIFCICSLWATTQAQQLIPLDHAVYDSWRTIEKVQVADDGSWIGYTYKQQQGDVDLVLQSLTDGKVIQVHRGTSLQFQDHMPYAIASLSPSFAQQQYAKRKKLKGDKQPKDTLLVIQLPTGNIDTLFVIDEWKADPHGGWIAMKAHLPVTDTIYPDSAAVAADSTADTLSFKTKWKPRLLLYELTTGDTLSFPEAADFVWADRGRHLLYTVKGDTATPWEWRSWHPEADTSQLLFSALGHFKKLVASPDYPLATLLINLDTLADEDKRYALYAWKPGVPPKLMVDTLDNRLPVGYSVSPHTSPRFSADGSALFWAYTSAPQRLPEDTLGDFEKPSLDVWVWDEAMLKTEQLDKEKDIRTQDYWAETRLSDGQTVLLADTAMPDLRFAGNQEGSYALGISDLPYQLERSYAYPWRQDWYKVHLPTGSRTLLAEGLSGSVRLSPLAQWAVWFNDNAWHLHRLSTSVTWKVEFPGMVDTTHDEPSPLPPFSFAGFAEDESHALFHSFTDVYAVRLGRQFTGATCLTCADNDQPIQYRVVTVQPQADTIFQSVGKTVYLEGLHLSDKSSGWYTVNLDKPGEVVALYEVPASLSDLQLVKEGSEFLFREGDFQRYPELRVTRNSRFKEAQVLSNTNPQQAQFLWGSVELYRWADDDGMQRDGLLYLPAGWQQDSSYPMIVYFYEKLSDNLHRHYIPSPSRSTVNPAWYASNGYVVFMPDIHYTTGYPGPSALNAIVSGTRAVLADRYADPQRVGIQGQSWGGYQTAYVITQTGLFKAAMAGAPVSNMTSAYGGIRWGSGLSRQFQYERTQSRIGATLWENPHQYILNSPLFQADRITTPLLIMHNDDDGAVPWYQGVELFMAMRRLGKPAWLLNYNGEEHNLTRWPNRVDLSIRMAQFFDHYLKEANMPPWMQEGIPVDKKGITDGY